MMTIAQAMRVDVLTELRKKLDAASKKRAAAKTVPVDSFLREEIDVAFSLLCNAQWIIEAAERDLRRGEEP